MVKYNTLTSISLKLSTNEWQPLNNVVNPLSTEYPPPKDFLMPVVYKSPDFPAYNAPSNEFSDGNGDFNENSDNAQVHKHIPVALNSIRWTAVHFTKLQCSPYDIYLHWWKKILLRVLNIHAVSVSDTHPPLFVRIEAGRSTTTKSTDTSVIEVVSKNNNRQRK